MMPAAPQPFITRSLFPRHRPHRHLLRVPVRRLRARHRQTPALAESGHHPAHRQDDCGGTPAPAPAAPAQSDGGRLRRLSAARPGRPAVTERDEQGRENQCIFFLIHCLFRLRPHVGETGQQVRVHPDHTSNNEAAQIQRGRGRRGREDVADGARHRYTRTRMCTHTHTHTHARARTARAHSIRAPDAHEHCAHRPKLVCTRLICGKWGHFR